MNFDGDFDDDSIVVRVVYFAMKHGLLCYLSHSALALLYLGMMQTCDEPTTAIGLFLLGILHGYGFWDLQNMLNENEQFAKMDAESNGLKG